MIIDDRIISATSPADWECIDDTKAVISHLLSKLPVTVASLMRDKGWNHSETARQLGINRRTLYDLINSGRDELAFVTFVGDKAVVSVPMTHSSTVHLPDEAVEKLRKMVATHSAQQCADKLGVTVGQVRNAAYKNGIKFQQRGGRARAVPPEDYPLLLDLLNEGVSVPRLCDKWGCSSSVMYKAIQQAKKDVKS